MSGLDKDKCNDCGWVWDHEDDLCPNCGSPNFEDFHDRGCGCSECHCCGKQEEAEELTIFYCVDFISGTCSTPCQTRTNGVIVGSLVCQACENLISIDKNKHIVKCKATPEEPHTCLNCLYEPEWSDWIGVGDSKRKTGKCKFRLVSIADKIPACVDLTKNYITLHTDGSGIFIRCNTWRQK